MTRSAGGQRPRTAPRLGVPRLERCRIRLEDGRTVGVAVAGAGMPLVVAHGFAAEGLVYAQTLGRLVGMGFKVVAIDTPGHGATPLPPWPALDLDAYVEVFTEAVRALGIRRAIFAGHSMGGRLLVEALARDPEPGVALLLIDPAVGPEWDEAIRRSRTSPCAAFDLGRRLVADTLALIDPSDLSHSARLAGTILRGAISPTWLTWPGRMAAPAAALVRASDSVSALRHLAGSGVTSVVISGERDRPVPLDGARSVAAILGSRLVVVERAGHSWLLQDPETLPAIVASLLTEELGDAWSAGVEAVGLDPLTANLAEIEETMTGRNSLLGLIAPPLEFPASVFRRPARYTWHAEGESVGI